MIGVPDAVSANGMATDSIQRIVIVGAGQAGGWAAKALRDAGFAGALTLVGDEPHPPHERPPLSKAVLAGKADAASTHLFKPALLAGLALDWRAQTVATGIHRALQRVEIQGGDPIPYDRLLLCTGGRARMFDAPGAREHSIHVLRTLGDSKRLGAALQAARRVLVIGGGWIGLEVAATARSMGREVTVVETAPRLCARVVPPAVSALLLDMHARRGVSLRTGVGVARLEPALGGGTNAVLSDGTSVVADCLVAGVGLVPNDELARAAGLACDGGILVDARCATSDPRIFAAGDVAVGPNTHAAGTVRLESWQNAQDQGIAAARAALGMEVHYDPVPRFWSDQYDTNLQILGWPRATDDVVVRGDVAQGRFLVLTLEGGRLHSAFSFNAARELRVLRKLIEVRAAVDPLRLADSSQDLATIAA